MGATEKRCGYTSREETRTTGSRDAPVCDAASMTVRATVRCMKDCRFQGISAAFLYPRAQRARALLLRWDAACGEAVTSSRGHRERLELRFVPPAASMLLWTQARVPRPRTAHICAASTRIYRQMLQRVPRAAFFSLASLWRPR